MWFVGLFGFFFSFKGGRNGTKPYDVFLARCRRRCQLATSGRRRRNEGKHLGFCLIDMICCEDRYFQSGGLGSVRFMFGLNGRKDLFQPA